MSLARGLVAALVASTWALVLLTAVPPHARAHDQLVSTTPADGATVTSSPARVELVVSRPAQALGTQVTVRGPDGSEVSRGAAEIQDVTVTQPLQADLPAGAYSVQWRVISADGHPVSGQFAFILTPGNGAPPAGNGPGADERPGTAGTEQPPGPAEAQGHSASHLLHAIAVGAALLVTAGALLVRQVRARR